ncbi:hypothetical protein BH23CHL3_BH23CHL3_07870 [soil metagenome]
MPQLTAPVQLSRHVYVVYSEFPHVDSGNAYFISGRYPTLIDCGSQRGFPQLRSNLSQLGLQVTDLAQVIATHGDYDHVQGFHRLRHLHPDLRLRLHRSDWSIVQESNSYRNASYLYGSPFVCFQEEQCLPLDDGDVIPAGDSTLAVHHAPGHTEGSICLLGEFDGTGILFAGDVIGGAMRTLDGASLELWAQAAATWHQSLLRLMALGFDWVLNGHEPSSSLPMHRSRIDRMVPMFGKMLNPWFSLEDDDSEMVSAPQTDYSGY